MLLRNNRVRSQAVPLDYISPWKTPDTYRNQQETQIFPQKVVIKPGAKFIYQTNLARKTHYSTQGSAGKIPNRTINDFKHYRITREQDKEESRLMNKTSNKFRLYRNSDPQDSHYGKTQSIRRFSKHRLYQNDDIFMRRNDRISKNAVKIVSLDATVEFSMIKQDAIVQGSFPISLKRKSFVNKKKPRLLTEAKKCSKMKTKNITQALLHCMKKKVMRLEDHSNILNKTLNSFLVGQRQV